MTDRTKYGPRIITHIDHGKSTLDRLLSVHRDDHQEMVDQFLDKMELERSAASLSRPRPRANYKADDGVTYVLNLIDTPGHGTSATR